MNLLQGQPCLAGPGTLESVFLFSFFILSCEPNTIKEHSISIKPQLIVITYFVREFYNLPKQVSKEAPLGTPTGASTRALCSGGSELANSNYALGGSPNSLGKLWLYLRKTFLIFESFCRSC